MTTSKTQVKLRAQILDTIYALAPISRIDIANHTGITPATTSAITGELLQEQLIYELGEENDNEGRVGRKKILLDIFPNQLYYVGAEIASRHFSFVLADNIGNIIAQTKFVVTKLDIQNAGVQHFKRCLRVFVDQHYKYKIQAIGIAVPGRYLDDFKITTNNQLWKDFDLKKIAEEFSQPVYFANNVNSMSLAKRLFSREKTNENFIYFHSGRGMHCSYIYNGQIYGRENIAIGEIGHTVISPMGEVCECGRKGCLQTYSSETWLIKKARLIYKSSPTTYLDSLITNPSDITTKTLLTAYELGDPAIIQLLEVAIHSMSQAILNLSMIIDAKTIYLHSPLLTNEKLAKLLIEDIDSIPRLLFSQLPQILIEDYSEFTGALAGVALAIHKQFLTY